MEWQPLNLTGLDDLLHRLETAGGAATWTLRAGDVPEGAPWAPRGAIGEAVRAAPAGAVAFVEADRESGWVIAPPFPIRHTEHAEGWDGAPLRRLMHAPYVVGAVLLRLEGFSVGVFRGDQLLDSRTGGRWIHGRNRAGGQSQHRFEHTRDKHIRELFDAACLAAREKFEPHRAQMDWIVLGGDRLTLHAFRQRCPYIDGFADRVLPGVINIVAPKRGTLERLPYEFTKCRIVHIVRGAVVDELMNEMSSRSGDEEDQDAED